MAGAAFPRPDPRDTAIPLPTAAPPRAVVRPSSAAVGTSVPSPALKTRCASSASASAGRNTTATVRLAIRRIRNRPPHPNLSLLVQRRGTEGSAQPRAAELAWRQTLDRRRRSRRCCAASSSTRCNRFGGWHTGQEPGRARTGVGFRAPLQEPAPELASAHHSKSPHRGWLPRTTPRARTGVGFRAPCSTTVGADADCAPLTGTVSQKAIITHPSCLHLSLGRHAGLDSEGPRA
jgi:hypothetical protein